MKQPGFTLIDAHLHLQDARLAPHLEGVLARAEQAGVARMVVNGTSEADWPEVHALAERHPAVVPAFGLHPWCVTDRTERWLAALEDRLRAVPSVVGEIGLDRWITPRDEASQEECFRAQLDLARRLARPVTVHCLRAWDWLMRVLESEPPLPAGFHLHAYGGPRELIEPLVARGAWFSVAGNILAPDRARARQVLAAIPDDRLLLETDAPDMPPPRSCRVHDLRGPDGKALNEPANLAAMLDGLARARCVTPEALAETTTRNARAFFGALLA
jgi:TatD DNase family protein